MRLSAELFDQILDALKSDCQSDRDKRLEPRVGMAGEATLVSIGADGKRQTHNVRIRDVSQSGIGLYHNQRFSAGHKFIIQLQSTTGEPIWLICISAYCRRQEADRFSVGARISQVLRSEHIQKMGRELNGSDRRKETVTIDASTTEKATIDRISRAILS